METVDKVLGRRMRDEIMRLSTTCTVNWHGS